MNSFPQDYRALIIGTSGGIGAALTSALRADPVCGDVRGLGRSTVPALDLSDEASIANAAETLVPDAPFHLIIDATGVLQGQGAFPEKALRQVTPQSLEAAFAINAIGPALLLKHMHRLLPRDGKSIFATLSARVGSIGDNNLGGWYGYRASKAALNMLLRTASIEIARKRPEVACVALHPGTVLTPLSEPFVGKREVFSPELSARRLLDVINQCDHTDNGTFLAYDGAAIVW